MIVIFEMNKYILIRSGVIAFCIELRYNFQLFTIKEINTELELNHGVQL